MSPAIHFDAQSPTRYSILPRALLLFGKIAGEGIGKLAKSLKPGGWVAIIDFKPDSPHGPLKEIRFPLEKVQVEVPDARYKLDLRSRGLENGSIVVP